MKAGENRVLKYTKEGLEQLAACLKVSSEGYISIPVMTECWVLGRSSGRYGEYVKLDGVCYSVIRWGMAYAKAESDKGRALVKFIKAMGREMRSMAPSKEEEEKKAAAARALVLEASALASARALARAEQLMGGISKADVMRRAWDIARQAVAEFGGKARMYIGEAMRMAWAERKAIAELPELTGTAKQVAWAADLRASLREQVAVELKQYEGEKPSRLFPVTRWQTGKKALAWVEGYCTAASWWIDSRAGLLGQWRMVFESLQHGTDPTLVVFCRQAA